MNTTQLRKEIEDMERDLVNKKRELYNIESRCVHNWGKRETKEIHLPGMSFPGDEPGTMGVDFRGPTYVPARTITESTMKCLICGKVSR